MSGFLVLYSKPGGFSVRRSEKPDDCRFILQSYRELLVDIARNLDIRSSVVARDMRTITERICAEGKSFVTKVLPSLAKALDKCLATGSAFSAPPSFRCQKGIPVFLSVIFQRILDADLHIADFPDPKDIEDQTIAIRAIRQICYLFYKLELPYSEEDNARVLKKFQATDDSLPSFDSEPSLSKETIAALERARLLLCFVFRDFDLEDIVPAHGPGAVATREKPHEKINFKRFYESIDEVYSYPEYFFFNMTHVCDMLESLENMEEIPYPKARVALVPKDSRGPRLISMEPLEVQWIQQGQLKKLVAHIERTFPLAGFVNFTDQGINRDLALRNSSSNEFVTLDLEDASDRVSDWLVQRIFPPHIYRCLKASRSKETVLPNGVSIKLKKFCSMGSAVCFPIEALTFYALAVGTVCTYNTFRDIHSYPCYVYGDDIIIPRNDYDAIRPVFTELSLKFNESKCCTDRFFRESCGMDAFRGKDVSPLRIKHLWSNSSHPQQLLSYISIINACRERQLHSLAEFLTNVVQHQTGPVPMNYKHCRYNTTIYNPLATPHELCIHNSSFRRRYNKRLQRSEIRILQVHACTYVHGEPDWSQLLHFHRFVGLRSAGVKVAEPCCWAMPNALKLRWSWVDLDGFAWS